MDIEEFMYNYVSVGFSKIFHVSTSHLSENGFYILTFITYSYENFKSNLSLWAKNNDVEIVIRIRGNSSNTYIINVPKDYPNIIDRFYSILDISRINTNIVKNNIDMSIVVKNLMNTMFPMDYIFKNKYKLK